MFSNIVCPVSSEKVDSNVSRLTAFLNAVLMIYFLFTLQVWPLIIVTIDYGIRAMGYNQYSLICLFSSFVIRSLGIKPKQKDKAQKVFASRLGFICAVLGMVFILSNMLVASPVIIGLFTALALLDAVFNFCVGCLIYNYFVFPFYQKKFSAPEK